MATLEKKIKYNKAQARKFEWTPEWFGGSDFDEDLVEKITSFQLDQGLSGDGMCGPSTYRRLFTERESDISDFEPINLTQSTGVNTIVHNGKHYPIYWDKVKLWDEEGGLKSKQGGYSSYAGKPDRKPTFFVNHWDVCLSASSCSRVLNKRGISIHYCLDNDGTIYQLLDTQHAAWHASGRKWNHSCIGIEVSDAYSLKYQAWYEKKGFGPRPIWKDATVHGQTLKPFLGFYDRQIDALAALWEATSRACDIPLEIPECEPGIDPRARKNQITGFCCHYHLTRKKIDCAGLDLQMVLDKALAIRAEHEDAV